MTILGKKRKFYEFSVAVSGRRGGNFTARQKFDAQGRYVQWIGGGDYKEILRPYDCGYKLGDCRHRRLDQYGQGRAWIHRSTLKGNVVTAQRRLKFEPEFRVPRTITLGKYNIRMREEFTRTNGTKWWRAVTKIVEP